jgi:FkbM family methyltransferase
MANSEDGLFAKIGRRAKYELSRLRLGLEDRILRLIPARHRYRRGMIDMDASLQNARSNGFQPRTIIDVGAFQGDWARMAARVFPDVPIRMFEANPEKERWLESVAHEIPKSQYRLALLGSAPSSSVTFHVGGMGSSVLKESTLIPQAARTLSMVTLDEALGSEPLPHPFLLKMDVQGYEIEILKGAPQTLEKSGLVLLEVALLPYNQGAPLLADVVAYMQEHGFLVYDIAGFARRETDDTLFMVDLLFARKEGALRARKDFWKIEAQYR